MFRIIGFLAAILAISLNGSYALRQSVAKSIINKVREKVRAKLGSTAPAYHYKRATYSPPSDHYGICEVPATGKHDVEVTIQTRKCVKKVVRSRYGYRNVTKCYNVPKTVTAHDCEVACPEEPPFDLNKCVSDTMALLIGPEAVYDFIVQSVDGLEECAEGTKAGPCSNEAVKNIASAIQDVLELIGVETLKRAQLSCKAFQLAQIKLINSELPYGCYEVGTAPSKYSKGACIEIVDNGMYTCGYGKYRKKTCSNLDNFTYSCTSTNATDCAIEGGNTFWMPNQEPIKYGLDEPYKSYGERDTITWDGDWKAIGHHYRNNSSICS